MVYLDQWFSAGGNFAPLGRCLETFLVITALGGECYRHLVGRETRNAVKHPTTPRTAPTRNASFLPLDFFSPPYLYTLETFYLQEI